MLVFSDPIFARHDREIHTLGFHFIVNQTYSVSRIDLTILFR